MDYASVKRFSDHFTDIQAPLWSDLLILFVPTCVCVCVYVLYVGGCAQIHWVLSYCNSQIVSDVLKECVHKNVYVLQSIFINLSGLQTASINTDRNGAEFLV